jgi:hypothetical protein
MEAWDRGSGAILNNKEKPSVETEGYKPKPTAYEKNVYVELMRS